MTRNGKRAITFKREQALNGQEIQLPCGQCIGCRLEHSRQWAMRMMHEASLHEENCFLTLTYDEENIPPDHSLKVEHFQKFMKRLRRRHEKKKYAFSIVVNMAKKHLGRIIMRASLDTTSPTKKYLLRTMAIIFTLLMILVVSGNTDLAVSVISHLSQLLTSPDT